MSALFLVSVALLFFSSPLLVSALTCSSTVNGAYYDLSSLGGSDILGKPSGGYQYTYYLNVCGATTTGKCAGHGSMVCQLDINLGYVASLAAADDATGKPTWQAVDNSNPSAGVILTDLGDVAGNCPGGAAPRKSVITFKCDPTATSAPTSFTVTESPVCTNNIVITSAAACPTSPPSGGKSSGKVSGGTVFVIILSVSVFVYVVAGCAYKRAKLGTSGMVESCPNNEFWVSLPGLMKDGAKFFVNKCRSLCDKGASGGGQTSSYESI